MIGFYGTAGRQKLGYLSLMKYFGFMLLTRSVSVCILNVFLCLILQISHLATVANSVVKTTDVFPPGGTAMGTKTVPMVPTRVIVPPLLVPRTNLSVPRVVPMLHLNVSTNRNCATEIMTARTELMKRTLAVRYTFITVFYSIRPRLAKFPDFGLIKHL